MGVIPHKSPRIDAQGICLTKMGQTFKKIFPILFFAKYLYSINAPAHNMMEGTGCLPAIARLRRGGRASSRGCRGIQKAYLLIYSVVKSFWNQHRLLLKPWLSAVGKKPFISYFLEHLLSNKSQWQIYPARPASPVAPGDGTGVGRDYRTGVEFLPARALK